MPLDPQAQTLVDQVAAIGAPPMSSLEPAAARQVMLQMTKITDPGPADVVVESRTIPGPAGDIPVRTYRPQGDGPLPLLVWFHGGGWVIGDLVTADPTCRELAQRAGIAVLSVDYRLAPEHPFPAGPEDCYAALVWATEHTDELGVDPARIAVGGDSAGGNLTAAVTLLAARRGGPQARFQLMVYPATDARMSYPSQSENGEGYMLTADSMRWFYNHYLGDHDPEDPIVSPIYAPADELAGLPPALVITAGYDPLRDEGEAYGLRLEQAGVPVKVSRYDGHLHGFFGMRGVIDAADAALAEAADALRQALRD